MTDLAALRALEPQAVAAFYREHAPQVLGWAIRLGGPDLDPEDAAQEIFETALRKLPDFRGDSKLSTWLFGVARRVLANARRKAALRRFVGLSQIPEPGSHRGPEHEVQRLQQRRAIQHALQRLSSRQREVLVLADLEGRSAPEVSELLSIPPGTVYSRLHAARRAFARALDHEGVTLDDGQVLTFRRKA